MTDDSGNEKPNETKEIFFLSLAFSALIAFVFLFVYLILSVSYVFTIAALIGIYVLSRWGERIFRKKN